MNLDTDLRTRCHVNTNEDGDRFVGVKADSDDAIVYFPAGYQLPDDTNLLRREILHLFNVLNEFTKNDNRVLQMNPLGAALGCMDFKAAIMVIGLIILDMVLYYPFFKLLEKQKLEEENSVQTN